MMICLIMILSALVWLYDPTCPYMGTTNAMQCNALLLMMMMVYNILYIAEDDYDGDFISPLLTLWCLCPYLLKNLGDSDVTILIAL